MTIVYKASPENRLVPSGEMRGDPVVHYRDELVKMHAVAVEDGVPEALTLCGITSDPQEKDFDQIVETIQCEHCHQIVTTSL